MAFISQRAGLELGQDPGRVLDVPLAGKVGNVYDDGRKALPPLVFITDSR
jgi:hypothetical protein